MFQANVAKEIKTLTFFPKTPPMAILNVRIYYARIIRNGKLTMKSKRRGTSDPTASHTHRQRLELPQQHPPLACRINGRKQAPQ
jgi:hypothetical protein